MRDGSKFGKIIAAAYFTIVVFVMVFWGYLAITEGVEETMHRKGAPVVEYNDLKPEIIEDPAAPQGIIQRYEVPVREGDSDSGYICMYVSHCYVQIYSQDELIYEMKTDEKNRFIHSPGSFWSMVPLEKRDEEGKLTVLLYPVYQSAVKRHQSFFIGSRLKIYREQLRHDALQIIICLLTMVSGLVLAVVTFRRYWKGNTDTANGYLGVFAFMIGVWKLTDCHFVALILSKNPLLLSAVTISALSISIFPMLNYIRKQVRLRNFPAMEIASVVTILGGWICLLLQLFGILEYRESLLITHSSILFAIIAVMAAGIRAMLLEKKNERIRMTLLFLILCTAGAVIDLGIFYIKGSSASIIFIVVAFLAYIIYVAINNNAELTQKANRDLFTGLFNRSRCNELLDDPSRLGEDCVFIMFDLNDLKATNDAKGHEEGDRMILKFVEIVKNESIPGTFIGRYGGDEFIAFASGIDKKQIKTLLQRIEIGIQMHNASGMGPEISYSVGCAFSDEVENPTIMDLFKKADERMYVEKKKYHEAHDRRRSQR
ncbi:MAG: GGDEF domain-containing protein [Lachnospiraceae bacterium]|nr:GGDEF domain-containing protein [Lachnospiraceae bacterium]